MNLSLLVNPTAEIATNSSGLDLGGDSLRRPAVFFDRDGVLMEEVGYCSNPADVRTPVGLAEALARLRAAGFLRVIITNQSGIGRGLFSEEQFHAVQAELFRQLSGEIDAVYFAGDWPEDPPRRRKPSPTMLLEAAAEHRIDLRRSWMIGDRASDVLAGRNAGVSTILVRTGYGATPEGEGVTPDRVCPDILAAVASILAEPTQEPARHSTEN